MNSGKIGRGRVDGEIDGSTRGPRGPKDGKGMLSKKPENWRLDWKTGDWMVSKKPGNRMLSKNS